MHGQRAINGPKRLWFRDVFEQEWRRRVLMNVESDKNPTDERIERCKKEAYTAVVRVFRGNPIDRVAETGIMTYNKDLAYLEGRLLAIDYLKKLYQTNDTKRLDESFIGKFDPTNPVQARIMRLGRQRIA